MNTTHRATVVLVGIHVLVALAYVLGTAPGTTAARDGLPLDDAWIHLVYGRNLVAEGLPTYNPGQLESGFTSPAWMVVAALAHIVAAAGIPVVWVLKGASVAAGAWASVEAWKLTRGLVGEPAAWMAGILAALSPGLAFAQVSGMEVGLTAAAMLATLRAALDGRPVHAGLLAALAIACRPEALLVVPAALFASHARWFAISAPSLLLTLGWGTYNLVATGRPLPATFYAKAGMGSLAPLFPGLAAALPWLAAGLVPLVLGAWALRRSAPGVAAVGLAWIAGVALSRGLPPDIARMFYFLRYLLPAEPLLLVVAAVGWTRLADRRFLQGVLALLMVAPTLAMNLPQRALYAWNCQNVEEMVVAMGHHVAEAVPPGDVIIVQDAGAMRYFGEHTTIDWIGLNSHELLYTPGLRDELRQNLATLTSYADTQGARWLVASPLYPVMQDPGFLAAFEPVWSVTSPHFTIVSAKAQGTLLLFRRRAPGAD